MDSTTIGAHIRELEAAIKRAQRTYESIRPVFLDTWVTQACHLLQQSGNQAAARRLVSIRNRATQDPIRLMNADGEAQGYVSFMRTELRSMLQAEKARKGPASLKDPSGALLPPDHLPIPRQYVRRVVSQLNVSFEAGLYDCTAVMIRRLVETMIIELFEAAGLSDEIKGQDGYFVFLSGLITTLRASSRWNLSRNTDRALGTLKDLGDRSAHNRYWTARKEDIERVRDALRLTIAELYELWCRETNG